MQKTGIEYLDYTWNPIAMRCTPCSPGCLNCWHIRTADRLCKNCLLPVEERSALSGSGPFVLRERELEAPMKVPKSSVIGVQFMGDLFHESVPDELVEQSYSVIHRTPQHIYLVLTKRSGRMLSFVSRPINKWEYSAMPIVPSWPFDNLWHGLTVCNQQEADEKIPVFLQVPGKKFLSIEPCLSQIVLDPFWMKCMGAFECDKRRPDKGKTVCHPDPCPPRINSVILGGETGPGARPMHPDWVRSVRDQCQAAGVPFFFKQWGEWGFSGAGSTHFLSSDGKMKTIESPGEDGLGAWPCRRVGRTRAGRLLDGREHNDLPWGRKVARNER